MLIYKKFLSYYSYKRNAYILLNLREIIEVKIMISKVTSIVGGIVTLIAGLVDIITRHPLDHYIYGLNIISGSIMIYLGILGIVSGLMTLYGTYKDNRDFVIAGGAIGLATPTEFSLLSIIGGLSMKTEKQVTKS